MHSGMAFVVFHKICMCIEYSNCILEEQNWEWWMYCIITNLLAIYVGHYLGHIGILSFLLQKIKKNKKIVP